jgi:hypothetical protein
LTNTIFFSGSGAVPAAAVFVFVVGCAGCACTVGGCDGCPSLVGGVKAEVEGNTKIISSVALVAAVPVSVGVVIVTTVVGGAGTVGAVVAGAVTAGAGTAGAGTAWVGTTAAGAAGDGSPAAVPAVALPVMIDEERIPDRGRGRARGREARGPVISASGAEGRGPCLYREKAISSEGWVIRILQTEFSLRPIASAELRERVAKRPDVFRSSTTITRTVFPFSRLVISITEFLGNEFVATL